MSITKQNILNLRICLNRMFEMSRNTHHLNVYLFVFHKFRVILKVSLICDTQSNQEKWQVLNALDLLSHILYLQHPFMSLCLLTVLTTYVFIRFLTNINIPKVFLHIKILSHLQQTECEMSTC